MKIDIDNASAIGDVVRASRKAQKIRQDDAAGSIGVSAIFWGRSSAAAMPCNGESSFKFLMAWEFELRWMYLIM